MELQMLLTNHPSLPGSSRKLHSGWTQALQSWHSLSVNDRADMLTIQCPGYVAFDQTVYDLNLVDNLAVLHNLQTGPFDDQIILVEIHKVLGAYLGDEFGVGIFFRVFGVQAVLVLDKQNGT